MEGKEKEIAVFGAGCFWCIETIFQELKGVDQVKSGFSGGFIKNPAYREVCNGTTGHAEVIHITYDPSLITFTELLEIFWKVHDPTTLNRQGGDIGTQYRSAIFHTTDAQQETATNFKQKLDASGLFAQALVTEITVFDTFYPAEEYHNDYFNLHGEEPYCKLVIQPKKEKFKMLFSNKLK